MAVNGVKRLNLSQRIAGSYTNTFTEENQNSLVAGTYTNKITA